MIYYSEENLYRVRYPLCHTFEVFNNIPHFFISKIYLSATLLSRNNRHLSLPGDVATVLYARATPALMVSKYPPLRPVLEELQEQFPLGGDVELFVDAPAMVLHRADSDAETLGDVGGRV